MEVQWARVDGKVRSQRIRSCNPLCHPIHTSHDLEFDHNSKRLKTLSGEINGRNLEVGSQSVLQALPPPLPLDLSAPAPFCEEQAPSRTLDFKASGPPVSSQYLPHLDQLQLRQLLSSLGDFDDGYDPYEACVRKYAAIALNNWNSYHETCLVFVETGPSVLGYTSAARYLHLNFKAKNNDPSDDSVQTFFIEVSITNKNVFSVGRACCLGLSTSLPVEVSTLGCTFCSSHDIHHPWNFSRYHNGREDHAETLLSQTKKLKKFLLKSKEDGFSPRFSHPGIKYLSEGYKVTSPILQIMALNLFNSGKKGTNFELVKCGLVGICHIKPGFIKHLNFKAKNKDDPGAPVETFFAEVVHGRKYVFALFCVRLDPSNSVSPEKFEVHGCAYCKRSSRVYHPQCPGYLTGRECDTNFELVKRGPVGKCHIKPGLINHLNFKAKNKDDPGAPVETFFAEVVHGRKYVFALFCVRLDPSNSISPEKFEVHGCAYCKRSSGVYHPQCPGYLTGRECVC